MATTQPARRWRTTIIALGIVVTLAVGALAWHLLSGGNADTTPAGWRRADPPQFGQVTTYAISQDVPGLAFAITGDFTGSRSTDTAKVGTLLRTRDGGAHWETQTHHPRFLAGAGVAMVQGGKGALVVSNVGTANSPVSLSVDAGDTWKTVDFAPTQQVVSDNATFFMRNGTLYCFSSFQFWRSTDAGQRWQQMFAPATDGQTSTSIAPDAGAAGAWYRVVQSIGGAQGVGAPHAQLEHSADDGHSWQSVQTLGLPATITAMSDSARSLLATNPLLPNRYCIALSIPDVSGLQGNHVGALRPAGPPSMPPHRLFLTGNTANGPAQQSIGIAQDFAGYGALVGLVLDNQGVCRTVVTPQPFYSHRMDSVLWSVAFGAVPGITAATPQTIAGVTVVQFAITPAAGGLRLTAAAYASHHYVTCYNNDPCTQRFAYPMHLIWRDLP